MDKKDAIYDRSANSSLTTLLGPFLAYSDYMRHTQACENLGVIRLPFLDFYLWPTRVGAILLVSALFFYRVEGQPIVATTTVPPSPIRTAPDVSQLKTDDTSARAAWSAESTQLDTTNTEAAANIVSTWLDQLLSGKLASSLQLEVLEAAEKHSNPAIKEKVAHFNDARLQQGGMATQSELFYGGAAASGRKIFFEHPAAQCFKCHRVGNEGGDTGPPLTGVGSRLKREELLESILFPDAKIAPGYETILIRLKDRSGRAGVIKLETETELTLDCPPDGRVTVKKSEIALRRFGSSVMPDGLDRTLSKRQLRDLVEFLAQLK
jgi:putative heme-binding domain-containing protein